MVSAMRPVLLAVVLTTPPVPCWLLVLGAISSAVSLAHAQPVSNAAVRPEEVQLEAVTIRGTRASLATVQQVRRQSLEIVDSVASSCPISVLPMHCNA